MKFEAAYIFKYTDFVRSHFPAAVLSLMQIIHDFFFPSLNV